MADTIPMADSPAGPLYACVAPSTRYTAARIAQRRFAAFLTPYGDEPAARCALAAAGGGNIRKEAKR